MFASLSKTCAARQVSSHLPHDVFPQSLSNMLEMQEFTSLPLSAPALKSTGAPVALCLWRQMQPKEQKTSRLDLRIQKLMRASAYLTSSRDAFM